MIMQGWSAKFTGVLNIFFYIGGLLCSYSIDKSHILNGLNKSVEKQI